jgi:hypothetical protein
MNDKTIPEEADRDAEQSVTALNEKSIFKAPFKDDTEDEWINEGGSLSEITKH